jgi:hypothetical protein
MTFGKRILKAGNHKYAEFIRTYGDDADEHDPDCPF